MNRIPYCNVNPFRLSTVGAGSLLKLHTKAVEGELPDDTKPALAFQKQIPNLNNPFIAMDARVGFRYVSNYFRRGFNIQYANEPAPTLMNMKRDVLL